MKCLKYNICLFFAILIFFIPVSVFSATSEETGFLNEINSAQSWAEIIEVVESNAGAINLDLSIYNSLTDKSKVTITLSGSKYQSLDEFIAAFNHAVEQAQKAHRQAAPAEVAEAAVPLKSMFTLHLV